MLGKYNVHCISGFNNYDNRTGIYTEQTKPIASFKNIFRAYKIDHSGGQHFSWFSHEMPKEITAPYVAFIFPMAMGYGCAYPEPAGSFRFHVNGIHAVDFCESKYSKLWTLDECSLYYDVQRCLTAPEGMGVNPDPYIKNSRMCSFGVATLVVPSSWVKNGEKAMITVDTFEYYKSSTWCRIDVVHENTTDVFSMVDYEQGLYKILKEEKSYPKAYGQNIYFGDVHAHSFCGVDKPCNNSENYMDCVNCSVNKGWGDGCGAGTIANNYYNAKNVAGLDYFVLTDHDFQTSEKDWKLHCDYANYWNDRGFTTLNAYECTSWHYGHRNVYFKDDYPPIWQPLTNAGVTIEPSVMFDFFKEKGVDVFTVPHHTTAADHPFCWERFDEKFDKMVEIFSGWGDSEGENSPLRGNGSYKLELQHARRKIEQGLKFGFIAGSDSHDGFAGTAQGTGILNTMNKFSEAGSGLTAVIADELNRDTLFHGISGRKAYATSGAKIGVEFKVNGAGIGQTIKSEGNRKIELDIKAPAEIAKIHILKNGKLFAREFCDQKEERFVYIDDAGDNKVDSYYARVFLKDREMAWITPIWAEK
jgi:hypothetical protein